MFLNIAASKEHRWDIVPYEFHQVHSATVAVLNINAVYGHGTLDVREGSGKSGFGTTSVDPSS